MAALARAASRSEATVAFGDPTVSVVTTPLRSPPFEAVEPRVQETRPPAAALCSRVYLPACAIAATAVGLIAVGWAIGWSDDFANSVTLLRAVVAGPATL